MKLNSIESVLDDIKKEFPIFSYKVQNNDLVYLDSANSAQKPKIVIDRIYDFYTKEFSNVGRSVHYLAVAATTIISPILAYLLLDPPRTLIHSILFAPVLSATNNSVCT